MLEEVEAQVVVIGSGPSGAVVSHTLATSGIDVLCLEQGDWVSPSDYPANHRMWELVARSHWATQPKARQNLADYPLGDEFADLSPSMYSAVGGSSVHYGALWPRMTESDFRVRSQDGVASDWPISYDDLVPCYAEVDAFIGVSGLDGDPAYPLGLAYPQPPQALGKTGLSAARACNDLGWHWWPGTHAIPTHPHGDLAGCQRWGTCVQGCPEGSKASFDIAYWPAAIRAGARLSTGARVERIETSDDDRVSAVSYIDTDGVQHRVITNQVVVCGNGIGTPRLLLLSATSRHPDGLANSSGMLGRNLMMHPCSCVFGYYDEDLETWRGPLGAVVASMEFYDTRPEYDFVRGFKMHASTVPGLIMAGVDPHRSLPFDELWGARFHDVVRKAASTVLWSAQVDDLPDPENRVVLSRSLVDSSGLPGAEVHYQYSENTQKLRHHAVRRMTEAHEAAGAKQTLAHLEMPGEPGHLLGTARMGDDPKTSVVDSFGRAHDVDGLRIADGSVFVTGGAVNPTSTITALALRVARQLVADLRASELSAT